MLNFIVNATSGRGKGQRVLKKLINYCYKKKIEYTVHLTSCKGHAERICKALCQNDSSTIVAVGGDGTFHEVLNGLDPAKTALGFIPSGRGNDFAKGFNIPLNPIKALERIVKGDKRKIDYIEIGGRRCLNVAGTGLDIEVLQRVDGKHGKITYLKSLIWCLFNFEPYKLDVSCDGVQSSHECITIAVCNCTQYGGGIKISPLSKADDGEMDIIIMRMPKNGKILRILGKFVKGKHLSMPITTHFSCKQIQINTQKTPYAIQLDGEIYPNLDFSCKVIQSGLTTF